MADPLRLTAHDRVMIHALELLSRRGVVDSDRDNFAMVVSILGEALPRVSADRRLKPMVDLAREFAAYRPIRPGYYGALHQQAHRVMQDWDSRCMAAAWDFVQESAA